MISGKATITATKSYAQLHQTKSALKHFREINGLMMSSIGIGTYLGKSDATTDNLVTEAIIKSVKSGINLIDTAINYRSQHGEMSVNEYLCFVCIEQAFPRTVSIRKKALWFCFCCWK